MYAKYLDFDLNGKVAGTILSAIEGSLYANKEKVERITQDTNNAPRHYAERGNYCGRENVLHS